VAACSLGAAGCSKQPRPLTASSAGQGAYALGYVDSLSAARSQMAAMESQVDTAGADFAKYPDALSAPGWADVKAVYLAADEAGRTSSYVEEVQREQVVAQFYIDEKDELNRRVGGAAQYAAKQKKECDVELSGPTSYALGKAFEERIRDRTRSHNEAFLYIGEHEDTLGKKNRPKLEDQSDAIAQTSYFVHVASAELRERMQRQVGESSDVDHTLQRVAEEAHRVATDPKTPPPQRTRAMTREQAAIALRQRLAPEVNEAKKLTADMEKRIAALRDKYDAAFTALRKDVEKRASAH
jgi:hypothetical protein